MSVTTARRDPPGIGLRRRLVALALLALAFGAICIRYLPAGSSPPTTASVTAASARVSGAGTAAPAMRSATESAALLHRTTTLNTDELLMGLGATSGGAEKGRGRTMVPPPVDLPELESSWSSRGPPARGVQG